MSTNSKKKPRKTKLVPRTYAENEDENVAGKQISSIKISNVKTLKTYKSKITPSKVKAGLASLDAASETSIPRVAQLKTPANILLESETLSTVVQSITPANIVSELKTPPIIVSQYETLQAQNSEMPFRISVNVEVEECDDEDRLQIDESAFELPEIKMELDETEVEKGRDTVSDDVIDFQSIVVKQERITPERELVTVIDDNELLANVVIKTEKDDVTVNYNNSKQINVNTNKKNENPKKFTNKNVISILYTDIQVASNPKPTNEYLLSEKQLLRACEDILNTSTNLADRILAVESRNIIGRIAKEVPCENITENKIQYALDDWKNWTAGSRRPPPLLYKCYICTQSWWYLSEFKDHLVNHTESNIKVSVEETSVEECNIIAYIDMVPEILDVEPKGVCWRCEKDYSIHKLSNRQSECYYTCGTCLKQFYSCTGLKEHEFNSWACFKSKGRLKCYLCPQLTLNPGDRKKHLQLNHSVRTDLPIPMSYKRCNDCGSKYFIYNMHNCRNRICVSQCNYCFRKFRHRLLAELHMTIGNTSFKCKICNLVMPKKCMELEHVLMHSTNFIFAYKCITCVDFNVYLDEEVSVQHRYIKHKQKFDKKRNYFDKVLVPISCILSYYENLTNELQPSAETMNAPTQVAPAQSAPAQSAPAQSALTQVAPAQSALTRVATAQIAPAQSAQLLPLVPEIKLEVVDEEQIEFQDETEELIIKDESPSDEEYEDDIIRLNYDTADNDTSKKKAKTYNCRRCNFSGLHKAYKDHLLSKCGRINTVMKTPKVYSCSKCNFQGHYSVYQEHLKTDCSKHMYINEDVYSCTKCDTTFDNIKRYLAHFACHQYEYQQCPVCLANHQSFSTMIIHFHSHIRQSFFKMYSIQSNDDASQRSNQISLCKTCSKEVALDERFVHWERHLHLKDSDSAVVPLNSTTTVDEDDDEPLQVPKIGDNKYSLLKPDMLELLLENLQCEKKRIRSCPQCYRNFNRNNDCKRHIIEHLLSDAFSKWSKYSSLQCQICSLQYRKADKYKRHMRDHGCLPIFQCEVCNKAFSDSSNFTKHKKIHNMKALICDLCNKKFQAKISLVRHMEMHKVSKPVTCEICVREFPTDSLYRRHMRTKHDNTLKQNYSCFICKKKFYTCREKWEHAWEVHKERKYKADCAHCGKSFRTYMALRRHDKMNLCTGGSEIKNNKNGSVVTTKTFRFDNSVMVFVNNADKGYVNLT